MTPAAKALIEKLGIEVPVLQAPIGGAATVELAAEVARAGGMGSQAITWSTPEETRLSVSALRQRAGKRFFVNQVLHFPAKGLDAALEAGAPAVTFSWGLDPTLIAMAKARGALVGVQTGHPGGAKAAIEAGADFIIAQGNEAGGHVQSTRPLARLLPEIIAAAGGASVIAAGGISTSAHIRSALDLGAAAVMLGTRFVATKESGAHSAYKQALVSAKAADTAYTNCFDIDWPYAMMRVLRNSTFEAWEAAGCPKAPHRPGEGDAVAMHPSGPVFRYSGTPPASDATGDPLAACLYAGMGVDGIEDVPGAYDLVRRLWKDV